VACAEKLGYELAKFLNLVAIFGLVQACLVSFVFYCVEYDLLL
jgi:hypothetical protein